MKVLLAIALLFSAATVYASDLELIGNTCHITGTASDDFVTVSVENGNIVVDDPGGITAVPTAGVNQLSPTRVEIDVMRVNESVVVWEIELGDGDDVLHHELFNGDPFAGGVMFADGGAGLDEYAITFLGSPLLVFAGSGSMNIGTSVVTWTDF